VFAEFLSKVMPTGQASKISPSPPPPQKMRRGIQTAVTSASVTATPPPPPIKEFKYEPPKQERVEEDDEEDYDEDDDFVEEGARENGRDNVGPLARQYLMPFVYKRRLLDTQYGIRKDGDILMIGDSPIVVNTEGGLTINFRVFKGAKGLWELLTRKKVNTEFITKDDLKSYKKILTMTNAHLTQYQPTVTLIYYGGKHFGISLRPSLRN